jgi:hypothetical protein
VALPGRAGADASRARASRGAQLPYGEEFLLVGDDAAIGAWDPARGVPLRWTSTDVWQASLALPRDRAVEYKLVRRNCATGELAWVEGYNARVPPLAETHLRFLVQGPPAADAEGAEGAPAAMALPASSALRALPVTRHLHRQLGGWWQPWYWAPELGAADGLVYLADAGAVPLSFDEGVTAAVDMASLLDVRDAAPNGFAGMQAAVTAAQRGHQVMVWGSEASRLLAHQHGLTVAQSKDELFKQSDVLSLHLRLSETTRHIVTGHELGLMKTDALIVNTSRAELIAPNELECALKVGRPGAAAVDVYESEPVLPTLSLLRLENVLATPHIGFVENDSYERYFRPAFEAIHHFVHGRTVNNIATKA